jgi:HK97 family phage portal protein
MRKALASVLDRSARWLKGGRPASLGGSQWTGTAFVDAYKRNRVPTPNEVLAELKNIAFTCASINAATCASYAPRLYVWSTEQTGEPKLATKSIPRRLEKRLARDFPIRLKRSHAVPAKTHRQVKIEEVVDHPVLDLFDNPNPFHSGFDLWELTALYLETMGCAYWLLERDPLGVPAQLWMLPAQNMNPKRKFGSQNIIDYYEYKVGSNVTNYDPSQIIHFRYPDPKDPYNAGLSPLRAAWEQSALNSEYLAFKKATWENNAVPGAVISPDDIMGEEERDRLEEQWNAKFRQAGANKALIAESGMRVSVISHTMGDLAALADYGATKEDIANAFHIPLAYFTTNTNLANLEAAERQHLSLCIGPRLWRRDEKLNHTLIPLYDQTGRLFIASDDPSGANTDDDPTWFDLNMKHGITTINEIRTERGLNPVPWGDKPWLPLSMAPYDFPADVPQGSEHGDFMLSRGRNTDRRKIEREIK